MAQTILQSFMCSNLPGRVSLFTTYKEVCSAQRWRYNKNGQNRLALIKQQGGKDIPSMLSHRGGTKV